MPYRSLQAQRSQVQLAGRSSCLEVAHSLMLRHTVWPLLLMSSMKPLPHWHS